LDGGGISILTARLELVPATISLLEAALAGDAGLGRALNAALPPTWPPEHYDAETVRYSLNHLMTHPEAETWGTYLFVERDPSGRRLIGFGGFKGAPAVDGSVEIGYSVVQECQRRGLATEAVMGFLAHAFADRRVTRVIAETFPDLIPSQGVLTKTGFTFIGPGSEPDVIRFVLTRDEWIPR